MVAANPAGTALIGAAHPDAQIATMAVKPHTHRHVIALRQSIRRHNGAAALGPAPRRVAGTVVDRRDLRVVEALDPFLLYQQTTGSPPKWLHPVRILVLRTVARSRYSLLPCRRTQPDDSIALDRRILRSANESVRWRLEIGSSR